MSSPLKARLQADLTEARKARDKFRTVLLTTTLSEVRNREIDERRDLTEDEVLEVLNRAVKRRRDAAEQMRAGARDDLADKEEAEGKALSAYLPEGLSEDDVRSIIREAIAGGVSAMGPVMGAVMPRVKGRYDGKEVNRLVREELGA